MAHSNDSVYYPFMQYNQYLSYMMSTQNGYPQTACSQPSLNTDYSTNCSTSTNSALTSIPVPNAPGYTQIPPIPTAMPFPVTTASNPLMSNTNNITNNINNVNSGNNNNSVGNNISINTNHMNNNHTNHLGAQLSLSDFDILNYSRTQPLPPPSQQQQQQQSPPLSTVVKFPTANNSDPRSLNVGNLPLGSFTNIQIPTPTTMSLPTLQKAPELLISGTKSSPTSTNPPTKQRRASKAESEPGKSKGGDSGSDSGNMDEASISRRRYSDRRQTAGLPAHPYKKCSSCHTTKTPLWRESSTCLCNACGIRLRKTGLQCQHCYYIPRYSEIKHFDHCPMCRTHFNPPTNS